MSVLYTFTNKKSERYFKKFVEMYINKFGVCGDDIINQGILNVTIKEKDCNINFYGKEENKVEVSTFFRSCVINTSYDIFELIKLSPQRLV